jgi:hypothetical protein
LTAQHLPQSQSTIFRADGACLIRRARHALGKAGAPEKMQQSTTYNPRSMPRQATGEMLALHGAKVIPEYD